MIHLKRYDETLEDVWDDFIKNNKRNATFLHSRKFFSHNPGNSKGDASLLFYKKNKLICVFPARLYEKDNKTILHSHPGSTYGGFVINESVGVEESLEIVETTIKFAKENNADEIIIRNPFRIFHRLPSDETDYAMWRHGFTVQSRELECVVAIDDETTGRYEDGTMRSINKSLKNVTVSWSEKYAEFWPILSKNLAEKHQLKPVHSLQDFLKLKALVEEKNIQLVVAEKDGKMIAGIVLFIFDTAVHAQYIASDNEFQELRPLNAVIDFIIHWCREKQIKYFNFGTANEDQGKKVNHGLFKFKEGFGGRGILRETMILELK